MSATKKVFRIHSWLGLITGTLLLVVSLSGALLVFSEEIDHAVNAEILLVKPQNKRISFDSIYFITKSAFPDAEFVRFRHLPKQWDEAVEMSTEQEGIQTLVYVDPYSGKILGSRARFSWFMDWMLRLHYSLFLGTPGRVIVTFLAIALIGSVVTGIIVYKKYILKVLLFRIPMKFKNWRTTSSELHRVLGVWALAFNLLIAITGFWILYPVLLPPYGTVKEKKEPPPEVAISFDHLIKIAHDTMPEFRPVGISYPRKLSAPISMYGEIKGNPFISPYSNSIEFDASTGQIVEIVNVAEKGPKEKWNAMVLPLHFGTFGGIIIKILYSLFGLMPSILSITGFMLWWRRNRSARKKSTRIAIRKRAAMKKAITAILSSINASSGLF